MEEIMKDLHKKYDEYRITVELLCAIKYMLTESLIKNFKIFYVGREMGTTKCKPDFVAERDNFAIIGEIKAGFPRDDKLFFKKCLKQIESFDSVNCDWDGPISSKDVQLFILNKYRVRISDLIKNSTTDLKNFKFSFEHDGIKESIEIKLDNEFSVWSFGIEQSEGSPYFNIAKDIGICSDKELQDKCKENIIIPLVRILQPLSEIKFYDKEPPDVYLLENIWATIISHLFETQSYTLKNIEKKNIIHIKINAETLLEKANQCFITKLDEKRGTKALRKKIILRFLDLLHKMNLAELEMKNRNSTGYYDISYKEIKNVKEYFMKEVAKIIKKEKDEKPKKDLKSFMKPNSNV